MIRILKNETSDHAEFAKWYLENMPIDTQLSRKRLKHDKLESRVLYQGKGYQVQDVIMRKGFDSGVHAHHRSDTFIAYVSGGFMFNVDGRDVKLFSSPSSNVKRFYGAASYVPRDCKHRVWCPEFDGQIIGIQKWHGDGYGHAETDWNGKPLKKG